MDQSEVEQGLTASPAFQALVGGMIFFLLDKGKRCGSGFFITPNLAVTARHNFPEAVPGTELLADWDGEQKFLVSEVGWGELVPRDLMLLEPIGVECEVCGYLNPDVNLKDDCWVFGHIRGKPEPEGVMVVVEDSRDCKIRVKDGHIAPGLSGAPAVNLRTAGVCGVVVSSRDTGADRGGYFISAKVLCSIPGLHEKNRRAIVDDGRWLRYSSRPLTEFATERRLLQRPRNYVQRSDTLVSIMERITARYGNGQFTTIVISGPSGSGKTTLVDDVADEIEIRLGLNVTRTRCIAHPQPPQTYSQAVVVDGLNDLSSTQSKRAWLEQLLTAKVRLITTASRTDLNVAKMVYQTPQSRDLLEVSFIELLPFTPGQTSQLVQNTTLPCAFDINHLAESVHRITRGMPLLIHLALDLACTGDLDAVPSTGDEKQNRQALFAAWRKAWLAARPDCDVVANCLCLGSSIGLSEECLLHVARELGLQCDVSTAIQELSSKGYIMRADLIDQTWIPHQILRDAYDAAFTLNKDFGIALRKAIGNYANDKVVSDNGRIRDLLTIIDVWAKGVEAQFDKLGFNEGFDLVEEIPPFVNFSNDLIGRLAGRIDGITNEQWKRWFASYIQQHIADMPCGRKIPLARAFVRLTKADRFIGDAFLGGWCLENMPEPFRDLDSAGEAYALIATASCWEAEDDAARNHGISVLKRDLDRRRSVPNRALNFARRMAFVSALTRLGAMNEANSLIRASPAEDQPELVAVVVLLLLRKAGLVEAKAFATRNLRSLCQIDGVVAIYLEAQGLPIRNHHPSSVTYFPNRIAFLAFCAGSPVLENVLHTIYSRSQQHPTTDLAAIIPRSQVQEVLRGQEIPHAPPA